MYLIERDIPPPARGGSPGRPRKYPFAEMAVGESFAADRAEADRIVNAAKVWKRRYPGWHYITRKADGLIRLWRVA